MPECGATQAGFGYIQVTLRNGRRCSTAVGYLRPARGRWATGEGGMIVTRDPQIAQRCKVMRQHGISRDAFDRFFTEIGITPRVLMEADDTEAIKRLVESMGLQVEMFGSGQEFLQGNRPDLPRCLVLDIRLPGISVRATRP